MKRPTQIGKIRSTTAGRVAIAACLCLIGLALAPSPVLASTFINLHDFNPGNSPGIVQSRLLYANDGNFYGVSIGGGNGPGGLGNGVIFKMTPTGGVTVLHVFNSTDGELPNALIQGSDGNLYGSTNTGGPHYDGTVFRLTLTGTLTTLHSFTGGSTDGLVPIGSLVQGSDHNLYGVTEYGGAGGDGIVFKVSTDGLTYSVLHSFAGSDGRSPRGGLVQAVNGNLYGTTYAGGQNGLSGVVYRISTGGSYAVIFDFSSHSQYGFNPSGQLTIGNDGKLYGTTVYGGVGSSGNIFRVGTDGTLMTSLYDFNPPVTTGDGATPDDGVFKAADGNFYGTTEKGGVDGLGMVFSITPTGTMTPLFSFTGLNGQYPKSCVVEGQPGAFYGATSAASNAVGVLYKVTSTSQFTALHSLTYYDGASSQTDLVKATDGNFYGATYGGGATGTGSIYRVSPAGVYTVVHSFNYADGAQPLGGLVQATDGNLYGTALSAGPGGNGVVYKLTLAGAYSVIYSFDQTHGRVPEATLIQGPDGELYGDMAAGGTNDQGVVFKITTAGVITVLHSLTGTDGNYPVSRLVRGPDGNYYGTASAGGAHSHGVVFKVTPAGVYTNLHSFTGTDGDGPKCGLTLGLDGNLYGTTSGGGTNSLGTVFKITTGTTPTLTSLHSFNSADGQSPGGRLTLMPSGNFLGTTSYGGANYTGEVFMVTPAGVVTPVYSFPTGTGGEPYSAAYLDTDGSIYGSNYSGAANNVGNVYRLAPDADAHNTLVFQNATTNQVILWYLQDYVLKQGANVTPVPPAGWKVVGLADFNGDGHADLLFQNQTSYKLAVWTLNGGIMQKALAIPSLSISGWNVVGVGDFNGDGHPDILFRYGTTSKLVMWYMNGVTIAGEYVISTPPFPSYTVIAGCGDFNGDGKSDILLQNTSTGQMTVWYMNGTTVAGTATLSSTAPTGETGAAVVNLSTKGSPDVVFQKASPDVPTIWLMNGATILGTGGVSQGVAAGWTIVGPR